MMLKLLLVGIAFLIFTTIYKEVQQVEGLTVHGKTYPGFTIVEKDGQYLKVVGPLYARLNVKVGKILPLSFTSKINYKIDITPTIDIMSLYWNGTVLFQGYPFYDYDTGENLCLTSGAHCPYLAGKKISLQGAFLLKNFGLFPGKYKGILNAYTSSREGKVRIAKVTFKLELKES